jgi:hypothetical protein
MISSNRLKAAARASFKHFSLSCVIAAAVAGIVFGIWYPFPYREVSGGAALFVLLVSVDIAMGPLLTLVVFDRRKPPLHLWRDLGIIFAVQLAALGYGVWTMFEARPVLLAYEGNRYRVVSAAELDHSLLHEAPPELRDLGFMGPKLIGAKLASSADANYLESLKLSLDGLHPALRPSRWAPYESMLTNVLKQTQPITALQTRREESRQEIESAVKRSNLPPERLGYLPLQSRTHSDWIVVVDLQTGWPVTFAHVDGW